MTSRICLASTLANLVSKTNLVVSRASILVSRRKCLLSACSRPALSVAIVVCNSSRLLFGREELTRFSSVYFEISIIEWRLVTSDRWASMVFLKWTNSAFLTYSFEVFLHVLPRHFRSLSMELKIPIRRISLLSHTNSHMISNECWKMLRPERFQVRTLTNSLLLSMPVAAIDRVLEILQSKWLKYYEK